jgi:hypothetical protein
MMMRSPWVVAASEGPQPRTGARPEPCAAPGGAVDLLLGAAVDVHESACFVDPPKGDVRTLRAVGHDAIGQVFAEADGVLPDGLDVSAPLALARLSTRRTCLFLT